MGEEYRLFSSLLCVGTPLLNKMVWGWNTPFDDEMPISTVTGAIPDSLLLG
jgi:hypothetical protein